ncbi:E3 ubiquitin-protein ligase RBBP6 [Betta splendens]|uniref:E3 ubiquitin-protein ligase RBBP6 n=1 Tax=Betta splendens TaxID=158456 RepID=A0A6P7NBJ2_BETSP|nr:E3 ubiquitin-protein ligase RBBP6 [Betta splendens]
MTHVHYKFSSKLSYDTVLFDGPHITLRDLKRQIMGRERLRAGDCDLQITNAQSKEEYTDDEGLIPKGSSVIVRRIPVCGGKSSSNTKTKNIESSAVSFHHTYGAAKAMDEQSSSRALPFLAKMANLAEADVSEEDKIRLMLNQSTYDAMNYNKRFGAVLPPNYTCYRCGNAGHHIRSCPASGDKNYEAPVRIRKSTGIPRSFMVEVDDPSMKGAMLTNTGRYAIPAIDAEAYAIGKKEKPPFVPQEKPASEAEEDPVPDELLCLICRDLLSDAVVIPCCGNSYCDDCIRTALLDSEEHVCPTCSQSDVSPDTLIANKFLRQAVNNFKKERGYTNTLTRRCGAAQSQNLTTRSSPVTTPPPLTGQRQPQKPLQPTSSQQLQPRAADPPPLPEAPPAATGLASACSTPGPSIQPEQSGPESHDKKPEEETDDDSVVAPSVLASNKEPSPAPSQQIPVVSHTAAAEQPETICVKQQPSSCLSAAPSPCGPPTSWDSSSFSSSAHPSRGWTETQQLNSATTTPLFPSPMFLSPQQSHPSFPLGYQPTTSLWPVPSPHGTPIPSLCSSMSTSSIPSLTSSTSTPFIPSLIPDEWYRHQRKKNERGTSYRDSTSRSKSYKSKSSRSYSNSSSRSRSRSRSRSKSRSRHQSPYSRHRSLHTRSHAFSSYSYGYKCSRSPTPSSSSSPRVSHSSRSKSPSDHQRKRHHSRHQNKKSSSSRYGSRRRGERSVREAGSSEATLVSPLSAPRGSQSSSLDLERERYLQWKKDYKEWCEKYFSSYVGHFHQLPLPLLNLPPPPPQWEDATRPESSSRAKPDSDGRCPTPQDGHSPSLRSSSASRSPPSHSLSDSRSTASQSFSDSSSPSHTSSNSRSPPLRSFSDSLSTPSEDRAQMGHSPAPKGTEEVNLQYINKGDKKVNVKNLEGLGSLKHDRRRTKSHKDGREGKSVSVTRDEWLRDTGPNACKDTGFAAQDKETISGVVRSVQPCPKSNKYLDAHHERESRDRRWRTGKRPDSRQDEDRRRKGKHSKERARREADQHRSRERGRSAATKPEKSRRRKGEEAQRNKAHCKSVSPNPAERNKPNNDKKDPQKQTLKESQIWEDGMKVAPQKKKINININLNLDGKRKEFDSLSATEKPNEGSEMTGNGGEGEGDADKEDVAETSKTWEKGTFREVKVWEEEQKGEGFDLWHCGLRGGVEEEEEGGRHRSKASKEEEEVTRDEEMSKMWNEGHEIADLIQNTQKEQADGEDMFNTNRETALDELNTHTKQEATQGDDPKMSEEQRRLQRPEAAVGDGSICEHHQEMRNSLEENPRETDPGREDAPVHVKVPLSRWDKASDEAEQDKSEETAQDAVAVSVPPPSVAAAKQETEEKRWRSVDSERDRDRQMPRRPHSDASHGINRVLAPSSGSYKTDSTMCTDGERKRRMERDRETGREGERSRERRKESRRPKDRRREEERGRDHKRDPPASGSSSSASRDAERREWQRGGGQGSERKYLHPKDRSSVSTAVDVPDRNASKAQSNAGNSTNMWVGESAWQQRGGLQEEEGSSSRSSYSCSSASMEDESRKPRKERRAAVAEHLEEQELLRHRKPKKNAEGEDRSGAEVEGGGGDGADAPGVPGFHG